MTHLAYMYRVKKRQTQRHNLNIIVGDNKYYNSQHNYEEVNSTFHANCLEPDTAWLVELETSC